MMTNYVKCSLVDKITNKFTNNIMSENGLALPKIIGLEVFLTHNDFYYGLCSDESVDLGRIIPISDHNILLTEKQLIKELTNIFNEDKQRKIIELTRILLEKRAKYTPNLVSASIRYPEAISITNKSIDITTPILIKEASLRQCKIKDLAESVIATYNSLVDLDIRISAHAGILLDQINNLVFVNNELFGNMYKLPDINIDTNWPI